MESNELRIFRAVAQEGSITRAAQILGYVQSNVTARIQQLEAELKTSLFYRQHGMVLTPDGEKLLLYAERILHLFDEARKALSETAEPSGRLAIGASQAVSAVNLPQILARYHQSYPKVDLSLLVAPADELVQKVLHFQIECAFVKSLSCDDPNLLGELVLEENLVLIAHPKHTEIEAVYAKPFLMNARGCANRVQLENWIRSKGLRDVRFMEFNNLNAMIDGVIADLGASFVPQSAIVQYEKDGLLRSFPVPPPYGLIKTYLIRHKDSLITSALAQFIEMIRAN